MSKLVEKESEFQLSDKELARLGGFDLDTSNPEDSIYDNAKKDSSSLARDEIEDEDEDIEVDFDADPIQTERKLIEHPIIKFLFIGGALGLIFFLMSFFLMSISGIKGTKEVESVATQEPQETEEERIIREQEERLGELKTANALGTQAQALEYQQSQEGEAELRRRPSSPSSSQPSRAASQSNQSTSTVPIAPVNRSVPPPTPTRTYSRTNSPPPAPVYSRPRIQPTQPQPRLVSPTNPTVTSRSIQDSTVTSRTIQAVPQVDPQERWNELVALGSYGSIDYSSVLNHQADYETVQESPAGSDLITEGNQGQVVNRVGVFVSSTAEPIEGLKSELDALPTVQSRGAENEFLSNGINPSNQLQASLESDISAILGEENQPSDQVELTERVQVLPGTRVSAELLTPIVKAQESDASQEVMLVLTQDLLAHGSSAISGEVIALPLGTQLLSTIESIDPTGLVDMRIVSVILPANSLYTQIKLDENSLQIRGQQGEALIAEELVGNEGDLRRLEIDSALLGAARSVGNILNRPDSQTTAIGIGGSVSTTNNRSPNIFGAILEGAASSIIEPRQARIEQQSQDITTSPNIWYVEAGAEVEVLVVNEFQISSEE